jgi:hypothetical protein
MRANEVSVKGTLDIKHLLYYEVAVWPWAGDLTSLGLHFLILKWS